VNIPQEKLWRLRQLLASAERIEAGEKLALALEAIVAV
jgi:hypothetical protein